MLLYSRHTKKDTSAANASLIFRIYSVLISQPAVAIRAFLGVTTLAIAANRAAGIVFSEPVAAQTVAGFFY